MYKETDVMVIWGIPNLFTKQVTEYSTWVDEKRFVRFRLEYRLFDKVVSEHKFGK